MRTNQKVFAFVFAAAIVGLAYSQETYEENFRQAAALSALARYNEAIAKYEAALRLRPESMEARSNLGVMYHSAGRYADAATTMQSVLRAQPESFAANLILGLSLIYLNRAPDAIEPLERASTLVPGNRDAVLGLAGARFALNQLEQAALLYRRLTDKNHDDAEAWYGLATCSERLAETAAKRLASMEGGAAYSKRLLAEYLQDRGEGALASEALAASASTPHSAESAKIYEHARSLARESKKAFRRLLEIAPDSWQAHVFLGDLNRQQRKFTDAIREYETALRANPGNAAALLGTGIVYWELADHANASRFLRQALEINSQSAQALFALGDIALKQHRDTEAAELLRRCLALQPDHYGAHAALGKAYLHLGQYAEAVKNLDQARSIDTYGDIHFQLAQALKETGRERESRQAMEESKRIRARQREREQALRR